VIEKYERMFERKEKESGLFALSPEKDEAPFKMPLPAASNGGTRKPLKLMLNPTANAFVPKVVVEKVAATDEGVTKEQLKESFVQKEQVLLEKSSNEFSINYDEPTSKVISISFYLVV
jgi:hypothetical protein